MSVSPKSKTFSVQTKNTTLDKIIKYSEIKTTFQGFKEKHQPEKG